MHNRTIPASEFWPVPKILINCVTHHFHPRCLYNDWTVWKLILFTLKMWHFEDVAFCSIWEIQNELVCQLGFSLSPHFNSHFLGEPGLAGVYLSKGWWRWWWQPEYWSYKSCKAPVKSSPPTNHHPAFLQTGCPSCRPTNSVKALKGKYHIPWTCLSQAHLGSCDFVSDH